MVRKNARMRVSEFHRDVTDGEPYVCQVDISSKHTGADDETLGRIQPCISEAAVERAKSHVCARRNILGACVLVWLVQCIRQHIYEWLRQVSKPGLQLSDQRADLRDRAYTLQRFPEA